MFDRSDIASTGLRDTSSTDTGGETPSAWDERRCGREKADGTRCKAFKVKGREACAGHLGLGIAADPEGYAKQGSAASAQARADRANARKIGTLDAIRAMLDEDETLKALRRARDSDDPSIALRAVQLMLDRVHGKPKETLTTKTERPADLEALQHMTQEERDALYLELMRAEGVGVTSA